MANHLRRPSSMEEWESKLRQSNLQKAFQLSFRTEMLYIKIVLLSPFRLQQPLEDYGDLLIFEHGVDYARTLSALINDRVNASICTSYDLLRTIFVAKRFLDVLGNRADEICNSDSSSHPPRISGSNINLPHLPMTSGHERLGLGIETLQVLDSIGHGLGKKYGTQPAWRALKPRLDRLLVTLQARTV